MNRWIRTWLSLCKITGLFLCSVLVSVAVDELVTSRGRDGSRRQSTPPRSEPDGVDVPPRALPDEETCPDARLGWCFD